MFGAQKRLILQYEARIADLKSEIENLRKLVLPANRSGDIPDVHMEADAVVSGREEVLNLQSHEESEQDAITSEASRLLSGTY